MRLKRCFWIAPTTVLLIVSQTFRLNFLVPLAASPVVAQTSDVRKVEADRLLQQGNQQLHTSQFEAAIQSFQQALAIYRKIGDRKREGWALGNLGVVYRHMGDYDKAIEYLQQDLAIAREIQDRQGEGRTLVNLGGVYIALGDYAKAIEYSQQSLVIAREIKDRQSEGAALGNLGNAYTDLGDYAKAIDYYQQTVGIARQIHDLQLEGKALGTLGVTYTSLGDYAKALEYLQQSLAIAWQIQNRQSVGVTLGYLGKVYNYLGDYAKAIEYLQQSLAIARQIQDRQNEGIALGNLGNAYIYLGDYARAIDYLQQHLAIARQLKERQTEGVALGNLGTAYRNMGNYAKAIDYYQQQLAIARQIKNRQNEGIVLGNLAGAYALLGDDPKAIDYYQQSLEIARQIQDRDSESNVLKGLGFTLYQQGNLATAEQTLIEAMKVQESIRAGLGSDDANKVSLFERQVNTYQDLQQVLIAQSKTDAALEIAERGRARAFVELLARRLSANPTEQPSITPPTIEQIKQIAKTQNATLVQYSIIPEQSLYIWVISPNGKVTFRSFDLKSLGVGATTEGESLQKLVAQTLESLGVGEDRNGIFEVTPTNPTADPELQTKSLKQLHQLLIQPIADLLPTDPNSHVIFIPHQDLFRVPFPALIDSDGKYLVEKHTILTAPSIQVLELTHKARQNSSRSGQGALVVGNPSPMPSGFQPLKGAQKEAQNVAQLLSTQPLIGSQATELAVLQQLPNARIIHLATHGTFNEQQPLLGGVALAQTGKDAQNDGLLTAEEIFNLKGKLSAELLVLSACNTGRGRITGDGVIGLSRSFISVGIPSVIVSLWSVPDAPTAELMSDFYTNLYQKKLDKAQALRQAMLKMMEKHPDNPRAWAAFTLIGEAE